MASTPSQRVVSNAEVLSEHLSLIKASIDVPTDVVPFFSIDSLSVEELLYKLGLESTTYATMSQMAASTHLADILATQREYGESTMSREDLYAQAAIELESEQAWITEDGFLLGRIIDQRTTSQRGSA